MRKLFIIALASLAAAVMPARADLFNQLQSALSNPGSSSSSPISVSSLAGFTDDQMVGALKDALSSGVSNAIVCLGRNNGFLTNAAVKIPLPGTLQKAESLLRMAGQSKLEDDFIGSMNHAAEQAVPVAASVFADAIQQMTVTDVKNIIAGPNDAATQFFQRTARTNLYTRFYPLVKNATDQVGVTAKYKQMMTKVSTANSLGSMFGSKTTFNFQASDIDDYVTQKALDGLFYMVAQEEKAIRANPAARTTDLLQQVFSAGGH